MEKRGRIQMNAKSLRALALVLSVLLPQGALAQTSPAESDQSLSAGELEALVAPIALYPDPLLSQIFIASTYPLEVVEAERWVNRNKNLTADQLREAVEKQSWDDSVKSLTATPSVLDMMSEKLDWTQKLGDAILAQQGDVMDAVQRLRGKAQANNKLTSNKQQTVTNQQEDGKQVIVITPAQPDAIYVPYYNPSVVYGGWAYPAYPPYYFGAPGYIAGGIIATGIAFGAGYAVGRWVSGGYRWGGGFGWGGNNININRPVNINNVNTRVNNWTHNPTHRQGVRYNNANVSQKFGGNRNVGGGAQNRMDFRGRTGGERAVGGGNRPNVGGGSIGGGSRANLGGGAGNRPNLGGGGGAGNRAANLGGAGNRAANLGGGGNALGNIGAGRSAGLDSARGRASMGGGGGGGGGGGFRGGGGGGGRGGGGRRSDVRLKHDIVLLGYLDNGIGFYRFIYNGGDTAYVGVMAQEVQAVVPDAVTRGRDGYLLVYYNKLGLKFQTYNYWIASGARLPTASAVSH
jgi:hypothetical protein